jgi:lipid kinase YegS
MGKRIRVILHGKAASRKDIRAAVKDVRDAGHQVEVRVTWEAGDSQRLAGEAVKDGVETVIAGGGDGTINEVASGLFKAADTISERPSFGILPLGTANDFARSCKIPLDPCPALSLVAETNPVPMDVGRIDDRVLINLASGGIGPKITVETNEDLKKILGGGAYFVTGITKWDTLQLVKANFRGPGFEWGGEFSVLAIGNARQAGGGNVLCPQALINDGLFDVRILPDVPEEERGTVVQELLEKGEEAIEERVVTARIPWVEIDSEEEHQINLDGEPLIRKYFRFEVDPQSLRIHLPDDSPVLAPA